MLIRVIIVDDEQPAVDKMEKLLKESNNVKIEGKFTDPVKALEFIKNTSIDAAFLDIEMPEMSGMELAKKTMDLYGHVSIIFMTAYDEYAVEAFRVDAIDYLMKPVDRGHLKETLDRIAERIKHRGSFSPNQIYCFGQFKIISEQGEVKFRTAKAEELLAFFINQEGAEVSRSEITDRMWPEFDGDKAVANFNTTLYYMKKALSHYDVDIFVERIRDRYRLNIHSIDCDYHQFKSFVTSLEEINAHNIMTCEQIAALYSGDYLEEYKSAWSEQNRIFAKEKYINLIIRMTEYYKGLSQFNKMMQLLKTGLKHEPLHEDLNYTLLNTFLIAGDRLSAIRYYHIYKSKLKKEFDMLPNTLIKKLMEKIK